LGLLLGVWCATKKKMGVCVHFEMEEEGGEKKRGGGGGGGGGG